MASYAIDIIDTYKNTLIVDGVDNIDEAIDVIKSIDIEDYMDLGFDGRTYNPNKEMCADGELGKVAEKYNNKYDHVSKYDFDDVIDWMIEIGKKETHTGYYEFTYENIMNQFNVTRKWIEDNRFDFFAAIEWKTEVIDWCFGKNKFVFRFNTVFCHNIESGVINNE